MIRWAIAACLALPTLAGADVACEDIAFDGNRYTTCTVDLSRDDLRLFWKDEKGALFGHFRRLDQALASDGKALAFAMNAGMYHANRDPVGHYVEGGKVETPVISSAGPGNFGLLPNGVFCVAEGRADVYETTAFVKDAPSCRYATQSGPMLVIDGKLHPRFLVNSTSRYVRNGVGTSADGQHAVFAISRNTVTFHEFGRLFRDALGVPNALYLDGNISKAHLPSLNRSDAGFPMGPIIGVVTDK
jgi:uncharacterized protein YigE (DUF2233 family)